MTLPGTIDEGPLRLLVAEDNEDDLLLLLHELRRANYQVEHRRVDTAPALIDALRSGSWHLLISDFSMPTLTAVEVLRIAQAEQPDLPCIVLSGTIAEEAAVDVLRAGARDFVNKERMTRLVPAIRRELREAAERRSRADAERVLIETRERMQFALEAVGVGTWEADVPTGRMVWSEVQERLHGLTPGTFGGTTGAFLATVHPDDRSRVRAALAAVGRDTRIEYRTVWPDGSVHWLASMGRTFLDENGMPLRAVGVELDITAHKQLEEQFRQAQKMESIGNLAGGIAHDFNNLLTVIAGCCELAGERVVADPEAVEAIEGIRAAAASATALTRQLLTFSRRQVVMPRVLVLNEAIRGFERILRRLVEENIQIEVTLQPDLSPVRVDPGQIEQLLLNLVANARDAMPDGGLVTITTRDVTVDPSLPGAPADVPAGDYVELAVRDTGSGMSPDVRAHLFEPFFTTKPSGRGTGLGLATVYGIVKQSGGHIVVESEQGVGSTFTIYLPVAAQRELDRSDDRGRAAAVTGGGETVLVVEDNPALRRLNERLLQRFGYVVLSAANGAQARQIVIDHPGPIHVVLMDVIMPGDSGPTVWEWIAERRPDTRVIYMSGYTGEAIGNKNVTPSRGAFLQKPFQPAQLAHAIREVLS